MRWTITYPRPYTKDNRVVTVPFAVDGTDYPNILIEGLDRLIFMCEMIEEGRWC